MKTLVHRDRTACPTAFACEKSTTVNPTNIFENAS